MTRLVLIGIDSMDIELVHRFLSRMPNLARMMEEGMEIRTSSTVPPDSITAWASIYTGMNPAEHGMVHFADPLDKIEATVVNEIDSSPIRGRTFWDHIGRNGKRVCLINPHLGYPPWKVNGTMIGRSNVGDIVSCEPKDAVPDEILRGLTVIREIPTKWTRQLRITECEQQLRSELDAVRYLMGKEKWDLFFVYSSVLDYIEHYFWGLCNEDDPSYPGPNPYKDTIERFYEAYDSYIGSMAAMTDKDQVIMVVSDHGHGMRPNRLFNFNMTLCKEGYLKLRAPDGRRSHMSAAIELVKASAKRSVNDLGFGNIGMKMLKAFPQLRKQVMRSSEVDWSGTVAYVSDQSGMKAYQYGGVQIKRDSFSSVDEYEKARDRIMERLRESRNDSSSEYVVKWCGRREEIYQGPYIEKYPDIVAVLKNGIGFGWAAKGQLFSESSTHSIAPGSHKIDSPVLIASKKILAHGFQEDASISGVNQLVHQILGVPENDENEHRLPGGSI